ncbi:MAG TPA: vitamin K epoxide reductase family protein [Gemmatimonadaceae bacterium]|nr:vitamin K epoxide reductase family protein [Gemmatimonadaceae bacterium]
MSRRMLMALVALIGVFLSLYLTMFKLGYIGTLACGSGSCETVQLSKWGDFLGVPVAAWGVGYYAMVLGLAFAGVQARYENSARLTNWLVYVTGAGLLFSLWLTYLELYVIHALCRWCLGSAAMTLVLFVLALWDRRAERRAMLA